jgi:hypothetical protein
MLCAADRADVSLIARFWRMRILLKLRPHVLRRLSLYSFPPEAQQGKIKSEASKLP